MAQNVRVLHVLGSLNAGGAESRIMDIYRHIDRSKVQFDFAIHTSEKCFFTDEVLELGGKIYTLPKFNGINYFRYKNAWKSILKKNKNSIIHGHMTTTAFIYLKLAKKMGFNKRIAHARNSNKDSKIKRITTKLAKFYATNLMAVSYKAALSEFGPKKYLDYVYIIPNLFNYDNYEYSENSRLSIRRKLCIGFEDNVIIHIGRFHQQKNHKFIIDIFVEYNKIEPEAWLIFVGEGPLLEKIISYSNQLEIRHKIFFLGVRSDVSKLLSVADCMLFPSIYEGLPGAVIEAQINGLTVIASSTISKEVKISDSIFFLDLYKPIDVWIKKITLVLEKKSRRNNHVNISEKFNVSKKITIYENLYLNNKNSNKI